MKEKTIGKIDPRKEKQAEKLEKVSSKRKSNKSDRIGCLPLNKRQCTKAIQKNAKTLERRLQK